jgi:TDG/mug DNA glycosylase family protein
VSLSPNVQSFSPLMGNRPRVLVLGSMPGVVSLGQQQYYAHPRNAFWPIMSVVCGFDRQADYDERCQALMASGVGLWDVLQTCERQGSLDSKIKEESIIPNDFQTLFKQYPSIERVCFNGAKAAASYRRYVLSSLPSDLPVQYISLPSTSPAHASLSLEKKLDIWRPAFEGLSTIRV